MSNLGACCEYLQRLGCKVHPSTSGHLNKLGKKKGESGWGFPSEQDFGRLVLKYFIFYYPNDNWFFCWKTRTILKTQWPVKSLFHYKFLLLNIFIPSKSLRVQSKGNKFLALKLPVLIQSRPGLQLGSKNSTLHHHSESFLELNHPIP